jgi:hypothetical protein
MLVVIKKIITSLVVICLKLPQLMIHIIYLNLFYKYEIKYTWNIIVSFLITL